MYEMGLQPYFIILNPAKQKNCVTCLEICKKYYLCSPN